MEVAAALAAQAGAPPRFSPYLQPRQEQQQHQSQSEQQQHQLSQSHQQQQQQTQQHGPPPSTFMGLPDRPPINVAPDTGPLRIPPPGMTLPSMANIQLSDIPTPFIHPHDVLCGRGGGTNNHNGNEKFRELVTHQKVLYLHSSKRDKPFVSRGIVRAVRAQNPPGRFLQKDEKTGLWYDIGDQKAREKTSQALREGAPEIRREITSTVVEPPPLPPPRPSVSVPALTQMRQMQLQRTHDDANFANMRAALAYTAHPAHVAAMVAAAGRGQAGMVQQVRSSDNQLRFVVVSCI